MKRFFTLLLLLALLAPSFALAEKILWEDENGKVIMDDDGEIEFLPPDPAAADDAEPEGGWVIEETYTPVPAGTWVSNESTIHEIYDPLMAASLLDSAGWKMADDGKRYKNGEKMEDLRILVYDEPGSSVRTNAANKIAEQLEAVGIPAYVETWSRSSVTGKLKNADYSLVLCAFNFDVAPDPGFTVTSTGSCNYTRYRSDDMNNLLTQLRSSVTQADYQHVMNLIQDQFEQDKPYMCLYWRTGSLLSRNAFTNARDIRELELLRGVESYGK